MLSVTYLTYLPIGIDPWDPHDTGFPGSRDETQKLLYHDRGSGYHMGKGSHPDDDCNPGIA